MQFLFSKARHESEIFLKKNLDFNEASALSNDNFNSTIRLGSPVTTLGMHRLSRIEFPSLLSISYHRLQETLYLEFADFFSIFQRRVKLKTKGKEILKLYLAMIGREMELFSISERVDSWIATFSLPPPCPQQIREWYDYWMQSYR